MPYRQHPRNVLGCLLGGAHVYFVFWFQILVCPAEGNLREGVGRRRGENSGIPNWMRLPDITYGLGILPPVLGDSRF